MKNYFRKIHNLFFISTSVTSILFLLINLNTVNSQCVSQSAPTPQIGAMLAPQFTNMWKNANANDKHGQLYRDNETGIYGKGALVIGDDGWPLENNPRGEAGRKLHGVRYYPNTIHPLLNPGDEISVRFKGPSSAIATSDGNDACSWTNIQPNTPSVGYTTAKVKLNSPQSGNGFQFAFYGRITEIQIIRPGGVFDDDRLLTDEYVNHAKHWKCFRFMGLSGVNSNEDQTWAKRLDKKAPISINNFQWGLTKNSRYDEDNIPEGNEVGWQRGTSWEDQIDICNYLNIDMWINVPIMADDNYIKELALLLKQRLKPSLNVNVEIGNEIWNFGAPFMSYYMHKQVLADEWAGTVGYGDRNEKIKIYGGDNCPDCNIPADGITNYTAGGHNGYEAQQRWQARRLKEYAEQFATVFGWRDNGGDVGNRIRMVLCGQIAYSTNGMAWNIGPGIEFLKNAYGHNAPRKYLYAVGITSYTTPNTGSQNSSGQELVDAERADIEKAYSEYAGERWGGPNSDRWAMGNKLDGVFGKARMFGLKMYCYEGGNELSISIPGNSWGEFVNANDYARNPGSGENTSLNLRNWFSWFGYDALFIKNGDYLSDGNKFTNYGISFTLNELNPIRKAYLDFANNPAPPLSQTRGNVIGTAAITTLDARKVAAYWEFWQVGLFGNPTIGFETRVNSDYTLKSNNSFEQPFIIRCDKGGEYKLSVERALTGGDKVGDDKFPTYCDIYLNEKLLLPGVNMAAGTFSRDIVCDDGNTRVFWWTKDIAINIPYGTHVLRLSPSLPTPERPGNDAYYGSTNRLKNRMEVMQYRFTLSDRLPPEQPKEVIGDLVVCKGNNKASYAIGENDASVCDYEWTGLPVDAKILNKELMANTSPARYSSGQGTFKIYINWGNVAPGNYTLSVVGKNQDPLNNWQSSPVRTFTVKLGKCGFEIAPNPVCQNIKTTFTPEPMAGTQFLWDNGKFGESNANRFTTATSAIPINVTYPKAGVYYVSLKATDAAGKESIYNNTINVISCNSPTVVTPVSYCKGATAVAVSATPTNGGTNLKWYTTATGNITPTTLVPSTVAVDTITYWVSQQNLTGESDRVKIDIIVSAMPATPTIIGFNPLVYCKDATATVAELTDKVKPAIGTTLKWYLGNSTTGLSTPTNTVTSTVSELVWNITQSVGNCESPKVPLTVKVNEGPQFTVRSEDPLSCNSKGKLILSGLIAGQTYKVSYNTVVATDSIANAQGQIVLNLQQGNYSNIKLASGACTATAPSPGSYTLTDPASPTFTIAARQPKECGASGAIVIKGLKNNTAYKISYNNIVDEPRSSTGDSISIALRKNDYSGFKVNLNGCMKTDAGTYKLIDPVIIPPTNKVRDLTYCQNQTISLEDITSRVATTSPAYKLRWYNQKDGIPNNQPDTISSARPITINRWVSQANANGCESEKSPIAVVINPNTILTVTPKDPMACGTTDGTLEISGLGNIIEYNIEYKKEGQSQALIKKYSNELGKVTISNLAAGSYSSITATPVLGSSCFTNSSERPILKEPGAPTTPPIIVGGGDYCAGSSIPDLTAIANSGGTIEWFSDAALTMSKGTGNTLDITQTTGSSIYYAVEKTISNCKSPQSNVNITIVSNPAIQDVVGTNGTATCNGTGYALKLNSSEIGVIYKVYKDNAETSIYKDGTGAAIPFPDQSEKGIYTIKAESKVKSCKADMTGTLIINAKINPTVFMAAGGLTGCEGAVAANAIITLSGSQENTAYTLLPSMEVKIGNGIAIEFVKAATTANNGIYNIVANNTQTGCDTIMTGDAKIDIKAGVGEPTLSGNLQYCNIGSNVIISNVENATAKVWSITPTAAGAVDSLGKVTWSNIYTGPATIKLVASNSVCGTTSREAEFPTTVTATPQVSPIEGDSLVCRGNIVTYQILPQAGITYNWSINTNSSVEKDDSKGTIIVTYMEDPSKEGATLMVTPESEICGLGDPQTKTINKDNGCDLFVPNILTPSTADKNSVWQLEGVENYPKLSIQIFNRWGAEVHSHNGKYDKPWDGTMGGKSLPTATYYYVIDKKDGSGKITGSVTVVRE